jgi:predicted PurR-regulated permease PerM
VSTAEYVRRVILAAAIAGAAFLLWHVADVLMILFAGIVMAAVLDAFRRPLVNHTPLSSRWALLVVVMGLVVIIGGVGWFTGDVLVHQMSDLVRTIPSGWERFTQWLERYPLFADALRDAKSAPDAAGTLKGIFAFATTTIGLIGNTALIIVLALFLAAEPGFYRRGAVRLFPQSARERVDRALIASGEALRGWLRGQGLAMIFVGIATWLALWILDVPSALPLGILAALLDFVPFIGPILAAVPGILVAFTQGPEQALYVGLAYLAVQQVESHAVVPLAQKWSVDLPPALAIISVVAFGLIFGFVGVLFATPLMVVAMVLVQKLYIEDVLEDGKH